MSAALKDGPVPEGTPHEPSMTEILASIRRIIADGEALSASQDEARGEAARGGLDAGFAGPVTGAAPASANGPLISRAAENSVSAAFQTLLASRFARHGDVVIDLTREMLLPMLKAWLDANLPAIVERLVSTEIERVTRSE
jgi:cell pole-organizing protein PopZ